MYQAIPLTKSLMNTVMDVVWIRYGNDWFEARGITRENVGSAKCVDAQIASCVCYNDVN